MTKRTRPVKRKTISGDQMVDDLFASVQPGWEPDAPVPDAQWHAGVMRAVRQIGPLAQNRMPVFSFGQLAWRLAPVALILIVVLSVVVFQADSTINAQLVGLAVTDPVDAYTTYIPF